MREAVSINKLSVRYGDQVALAPLTLKLPAAQLIFVIGPNGSGKSSLITALLGLTPHTGDVKIFGQPVKNSYHNLGYVPQRFSFDRSIPLTVRELLSLSLAFCGCHPGRADDHLVEALDQVGLAELIDRPLAELSGGQLQRVLLARALVHHPKLVILDEPEAGVDRQAERSLYPLLKNLTAEGLTVVIASHELEAARRWADLVVALDGRLVASGAPRDVLTKQRLGELFRA